MNYISLLAVPIGFVISVLLTYFLIPVLRRFKFGQEVREEGPRAHLKKAGTPTIGGIAIVIAFIIASLIFSGQSGYIITIVVFTFLFAVIGFLDDYLKIKKHESEGLKAWQKMGFQIIVMILLILYIVLFTKEGTSTIVPFYGMVDFKGWFYPLAFFAILGTVNGANFTDGVDGLASSVTIVIAAFLTFAAALLMPGISPASLAMMGALAGFLVFNAHPAKIFMGDTGSLALGGFVVTMALLMKIPIFLIFFAFIYLIEIISVILQVGYFKLTHGKRIFRMTPIHHHYELGGWSENKVVLAFSLVTLILSVVSWIGLSTAAY